MQQGMLEKVLSKARFLIVDDESSNVRLLERLLELAKSGPVFSTTDPRQAMALFKAQKPDIVLLDLHMPHIDGFTLMTAFREAAAQGEYLPVLVLTADITPETRQRALARGAHDFLTKPLDPDEVLLRIRNLLETRFLHQALQKQNEVLEAQVKERTFQLEETLGRLMAAQQQLVKQERLRALGMMASGIAHDFNNALTMVLGYGELLANHFKNDAPPRERDLFNYLIAAAQDASHVVTRLRNFYRPADQDELRVPVDVNLAIQQAIVLTAPRWRDKSRAEGVFIKVETDLGDLPPFLGHSPEFREVLTNLIFNAVDAMPKGGRLRFETQCRDGRIQVRVSDDGIGMTEEECSRCLEPFYTTKGEQGTGLGLATVYGFVQRYGGSIGIESRKGEGTAFTLTLPAFDGMHVDHDAADEGALRSLRVLVVDDQEIIRQIITEMLQADGHFALPVADGAAVLRELASGGWDLVISDQSMPEMTGSELAEAMRARGIRVPVILLTGFGDEMRVRGGTPPGVDLLLSKPVTAGGLRSALQGVVDCSGQVRAGGMPSAGRSV
jgi:signal transduction histidine kinase